MGNFGIFDTAQQRDAFNAWCHEKLAAEAETLKVIGIKDADDMSEKFGLLCSLYETIIHCDGDLEDENGEMLLLTSPDARAFADKVFEIMYGGAWR
jgi:hypothetical protein